MCITLEKKLIPDMFHKGYKLYSILFLKCPKCHDSDLFIEKRIYKVAGYFDMPESCPKCQQENDFNNGPWKVK